jgi:uncharacterized delta-60 repeat protein
MLTKLACLLGFSLLVCRAGATVDPSFNCVLGGENGEVYTMVRQGDGKILVGGDFTSVKGVVCYGIARMFPSGVVDTNFDAGLLLGGSVYAIAPLADGRVVIGGSFTGINGTPRFGLACLGPSGVLDPGFNANAGVMRSGKPASVFAILVQPDGNLVIGGNFDTANGVGRSRVARMSSSGVLDDFFSQGTISGSIVNALALQDDGKVIAGGSFWTVNDVKRQNLVRLNVDGTLDTNFDPLDQVYNTCNSILPLPDGRIMVAGVNYCRRLMPDGKSLDPAFVEPEIYYNATAYAIVPTPDNGYALGGEFYQVGNRYRLASVAFGTNTYLAVGDAVYTYTDDYPDRTDLVNFKGNAALSTSRLTGVAFGDNTFVAVGPSSTVLVTKDLKQWDFRPTDAQQGFNTVAFSNGTFVAAGPSGVIRFSTDAGSNWQAAASVPTLCALNGLAFNGNIWVAVGGKPGAGTILYSTDASTWSSATAGTNILFAVVAGRDKFVAVGENGGILISPDGYVWTAATNSYTNSLYGVAYGDNLFMAVGASGRIVYSGDGNSWTNVYNYSMQSPQQDLFSVTFANRKFIAPGGNGTMLVSNPGYTRPYLADRPLADRISVAAILFDGNGVLRKTFVSGINDLISNYKETVRAILPDATGLLVAGNFVRVTYTNSPNDMRATNACDIAHLQLDGTLDLSIDIGMGVGGESPPSAIVVQPDGKILLGGDFVSVNGVSRNRIARVNADGSLDETFDPGNGADRRVASIALSPNGQIFAGGMFNIMGNVSTRPVARLNADGSADPGFYAGYGGSTFNDTISSMAVQPDLKVLVNGSKKRVARLNADGTDDVTFNIGSGASAGYVNSIVVQPDGKILLAGSFTNFNGQTAKGLARLWPAGTNDEPFMANFGVGANKPVSSTIIQTNTSGETIGIVLGGTFTDVEGVACARIAWLDGNGLVDPAFAVNAGTDTNVSNLAEAPGGTSHVLLFASGIFTNFNGVPRTYLARLNGDGTLDRTFNSGAGPDGAVYALAVQADAKALLGGSFRAVDGKRCLSFFRMQEDCVDGGLAQWKSTWFTPAQLADPNISGDNVDLNGDGLVNFVKYAFNMDPKSTSRNGLPVCEIQRNASDGHRYIIFSYHRRIGSAGVQYSLEVANDLSKWETTPSRLEEISLTPDAGGVTETVQLRVKPSVEELPAAFVRIRVIRSN